MKDDLPHSTDAVQSEHQELLMIIQRQNKTLQSTQNETLQVVKDFLAEYRDSATMIHRQNEVLLNGQKAIMEKLMRALTGTLHQEAHGSQLFIGAQSTYDPMPVFPGLLTDSAQGISELNPSNPNQTDWAS
jgi:lactam utilization protein B